jgi:hypothetical protein
MAALLELGLLHSVKNTTILVRMPCVTQIYLSVLYSM